MVFSHPATLRSISPFLQFPIPLELRSASLPLDHAASQIPLPVQTPDLPDLSRISPKSPIISTDVFFSQNGWYILINAFMPSFLRSLHYYSIFDPINKPFAYFPKPILRLIFLSKFLLAFRSSFALLPILQYLYYRSLTLLLCIACLLLQFQVRPAPYFLRNIREIHRNMSHRDHSFLSMVDSIYEAIASRSGLL